MYSNSELLQSYVCNVVSAVFSDQSTDPLKIKLAKAAIGSIPRSIVIDTTPFTNMVINNTSLKQNPPSIEYEDGFALVNEWKDTAIINVDLPKLIEASGNKIGDLIKK